MKMKTSRMVVLMVIAILCIFSPIFKSLFAKLKKNK